MERISSLSMSGSTLDQKQMSDACHRCLLITNGRMSLPAGDSRERQVALLQPGTLMKSTQGLLTGGNQVLVFATIATTGPLLLPFKASR
jgi:hypothetical protein